jgi:ArsR family transcriptional regulator, arsenate/arsenite/antimonite-responsive transcriptional repressor
MRDLMKITKALADENRIRVLLALRRGELCACQITELFGLAPSTMSKHMSVLYQAGLVDSRKEGRWIYFRLPNGKANGAVGKAIRWISKAAEDQPRIQEDAKRLKRIVSKAAEDQPRIQEDAKRLKRIVGMDPSDICKKQCCK